MSNKAALPAARASAKVGDARCHQRPILGPRVDSVLLSIGPAIEAVPGIARRNECDHDPEQLPGGGNSVGRGQQKREGEREIEAQVLDL